MNTSKLTGVDPNQRDHEINREQDNSSSIHGEERNENEEHDEYKYRIVSTRKSLCAVYYLVKFLSMISLLALSLSMTLQSTLTSLLFSALSLICMAFSHYTTLIIYSTVLYIIQIAYMLTVTVIYLTSHLISRMKIIRTLSFNSLV